MGIADQLLLEVKGGARSVFAIYHFEMMTF